MAAVIVDVPVRPLAPRTPRVVLTPDYRSTAVLLTRTHHSENEWAAVYPLIEHMYIRERRKLRDVMARMENQHGFRAT